MVWGAEKVTSSRKVVEMNHLAHETSPYLKQHANNPVDWYPWGEEAFELARSQNKPVFLSIGYSSCHWCHVMAHESFEDDVVAQILNREYISVKVDREERPDIDAVYIEFCTLMTGRAGWPTTLILTPSKDPIFAATYIPKDGSNGQMGLIGLLNNVAQMWHMRQAELEQNAAGITSQAQNIIALPDPLGMPKRVVEKAYEQLLLMFDKVNGGFGKGSKFPMGHNVRFLLRYLQREAQPELRHVARTTLDSMCGKGLYDHVGGGFYRYTVDDAWQTPHFEKMLSDNALLAQTYIEASIALEEPLYEKIAVDTLESIERAFLLEDGTFASALDADYQGVEGGYYLWTQEALHEVLKGDYEEFAELFCVDKNAATCVPVPEMGAYFYRKRDAAAYEFGEACLAKLKAARPMYKTAPLGRDDKVVTWINALTIAAFAEVGHLLGRRDFIGTALRAYDALIQSNTTGAHWISGVVACSCEGKRTPIVVLKDYAYLLEAAIRLYEATQNARYLEDAKQLAAEMERKFKRPDGALYLTDKDGERLPLDIARAADGALPSGASQAAYALELLEMSCNTCGARQMADEIYESFSGAVHENPGAYPWLFAAYFLKELGEKGRFKREF